MLKVSVMLLPDGCWYFCWDSCEPLIMDMQYQAWFQQLFYVVQSHSNYTEGSEHATYTWKLSTIKKVNF